jgi:hypothetical protein
MATQGDRAAAGQLAVAVASGSLIWGRETYGILSGLVLRKPPSFLAEMGLKQRLQSQTRMQPVTDPQTKQNERMMP